MNTPHKFMPIPPSNSKRPACLDTSSSAGEGDGDGHQKKWFAAISEGAGRLVYRRGPHRRAVSGKRTRPHQRCDRHIRTPRAHGLAHASARADADRHSWLRPRAALRAVRSRTIRPGDVVWIPPGEKHWHGASPTTAMTHIAIAEALDGKVVDWMEQVSDEQYQA